MIDKGNEAILIRLGTTTNNIKGINYSLFY